MTDNLEDLRRLEAAATPAPWANGVSANRKWVLVLANSGTEDEELVARLADDIDAELIAAARNELPRLLAALDAVQALHEPVDALMYGSKNAHKVQVCTGCGQDDGNWNRWPCPTVAAIIPALKGDQP